MLILKAVAHETIWGGERLRSYCEGTGKIGHLYSLCCEKGLETVILNGPYQNKTFDCWFQEHKNQFGLGYYDIFPFTIALVEACDNLSIQVHPDDRIAREEEGAAYGKNESWFFLHAPENGNIFNGCLAKDQEEVRKCLQAGEIMSVVDTLPVEVGDYVYVEAGTLHALTAGSFLYEIEESSPWTYRLYDYDRTDEKGNKRELHIDKALKALKTQYKSRACKLGTACMEERMYVLQKLENITKYRNESCTLECITLLEGGCDMEQEKFKVGMTIVLEPDEILEGDLALAMLARPKNTPRGSK